MDQQLPSDYHLSNGTYSIRVILPAEHDLQKIMIDDGYLTHHFCPRGDYLQSQTTELQEPRIIPKGAAYHHAIASLEDILAHYATMDDPPSCGTTIGQHVLKTLHQFKLTL